MAYLLLTMSCAWSPKEAPSGAPRRHVARLARTAHQREGPQSVMAAKLSRWHMRSRLAARHRARACHEEATPGTRRPPRKARALTWRIRRRPAGPAPAARGRRWPSAACPAPLRCVDGRPVAARGTRLLPPAPTARCAAAGSTRPGPVAHASTRCRGSRAHQAGPRCRAGAPAAGPWAAALASERRRLGMSCPWRKERSEAAGLGFQTAAHPFIQHPISSWPPDLDERPRFLRIRVSRDGPNGPTAQFGPHAHGMFWAVFHEF